MAKAAYLLFWLFIITSPQIFSNELTIKDVAETEKRSIISENKVEAIDKTSNKSTPLKILVAFKDNTNNHNWKEAAKYLDLRYIEPRINDKQAETLVRQLQIFQNNKLKK